MWCNTISLKEPVCHEKYLKTKIKTYECKINTTFYDDGRFSLQIDRQIDLR